MKKHLLTLVSLLFLLISCQKKDIKTNLTRDQLKDKIAGGWAGKIIGVTYGAPTEFHALGNTFEDSIRWVPADVKGSLWQDDLYVQLTFMMTMDEYGMDAPAKVFQEKFAKEGYPLWHANVQARKNYFDSIFAPASGEPENNMHADDIDFQIEADYIGFMCPAMPATANKIGEKIGHIMNYGDGVYGGLFVSGLYSAAFFSENMDTVILQALKSIPANSDYASIIRDVLLLHQHYPDDWRMAWKELQAKWGEVAICGAGSSFNIDAKLNGAYIVMGLLYGNGDPAKTLEITTRCGQDSDCNPSNALAVLGVMKGFNNFPESWKMAILAMADSNFIFTDYSFNKAVENTLSYAEKLVVQNGGKVTGKNIEIKPESPVAPALEVSFPNLVTQSRVSVSDPKGAWTFKGNWNPFPNASGEKAGVRVSGKKGDEALFTFTGTGVTFMGNWKKDGGKAEVYVDGKLHKKIDTYFFYANQEHDGINIWHVLNLPKGKHTVRLLVSGEKNAASSGTNIFLSEAIVFDTGSKKNETYRFSFQ